MKQANRQHFPPKFLTEQTNTNVSRLFFFLSFFLDFLVLFVFFLFFFRFFGVAAGLISLGFGIVLFPFDIRCLAFNQCFISFRDLPSDDKLPELENTEVLDKPATGREDDTARRLASSTAADDDGTFACGGVSCRRASPIAVRDKDTIVVCMSSRSCID